MEMTEWVIIFHIFITADIGPPDTVLRLTIVLALLSMHCSPSMGKADFNPVPLWNDNVYQLSFNRGAMSVTHIPSVSKRRVNVLGVADTEEVGIVRPLRAAWEREDSLTEGMNTQAQFLLDSPSPRLGSGTYTLHRSPYGPDA